MLMVRDCPNCSSKMDYDNDMDTFYTKCAQNYLQIILDWSDQHFE